MHTKNGIINMNFGKERAIRTKHTVLLKKR